MSSGSTLQPTFTGHVATTQDALILFEACLQGHLSHVPRRPHDRERNSLIRSGCVFIYEENASGIKRWTDGVTWSPSRILGNFLVYRELDKPFPPGEKKRANKNKNTRRPSRPGDPYARPDAPVESYSPTVPQAPPFSPEKSSSEMERQLIGSLIDSYGFKADGLVKKTMSVTVQGVTHHLVSYYNVNDVLNNRLQTPSQTENLTYIRPRAELTSNQSFRSPLEEVDEYENQARQAQAQGYGSYPVQGRGYMQEYSKGYYHYPPMPPHQQPATYQVGNSPMPPNYLPTPSSGPVQPHRNSHYGSYDGAQYNRSYESLNGSGTPGSSQTGVSAAPNPPMPPNMNDRPHQQPPMYPQSQGPPRQLGNMSPVSIEPRQGQHYYPPAGDHSPADGRGQVASPHLKYEDSRGGHHSPAPVYNNQRPQYYGEGPGPAMHQSPYGQAPPISPWQGPGPAHNPQ